MREDKNVLTRKHNGTVWIQQLRIIQGGGQQNTRGHNDGRWKKTEPLWQKEYKAE